MGKLIFGVGLNDADYPVYPASRIMCPIYSIWHSMLRRCYSPYTHKRQGAYIECEVCEEWKCFSAFRSWVLTQKWEGRELDKDFLSESKVYSPSTCTFLPKKLNNLIIRRAEDKRKMLRGVIYIPKTRSYRARLNLGKKRLHLGLFATEEEAHFAYLKGKLQIVQDYLTEFEEEDNIVLGLERIAVKLQNAIDSKLIVEDF